MSAVGGTHNNRQSVIYIKPQDNTNKKSAIVKNQ